MNILVTNAKNRIAYNIVKSLAIKGYKVYCADFVPRAMTFYSRYSSGSFLYPSPFSRQEKFVEYLIAKIKELNIDVLIPVFEELFLIAKHKQKFLEHVKLAVSDYETILIAHNKDKWEPIAKGLGVFVPKTFTIDDLKADSSIIEQKIYPIIIKPKQGGGGWGIGQVNSYDEFMTILDKGTYQNNLLDRYIFQKKIQGETICVGMVLNHGKLKGKTCYRQIREYPAYSGQATCRISMSNLVAENFLQKLLEHLNWHGVCQADFIVEKNTNTPYLIDINPRFWGSLIQGIASGVDFPNLILGIAAHGDVQPAMRFQLGVQTRWLGGELRGFYQHFSNSNSKSTFLKTFFRPLTNTVCFDDFSLSDPMPFTAWCYDSLYRIIKFRSNKPHESLDGIWQ